MRRAVAVRAAPRCQGAGEEAEQAPRGSGCSQASGAGCFGERQTLDLRKLNPCCSFYFSKSRSFSKSRNTTTKPLSLPTTRTAPGSPTHPSQAQQERDRDHFFQRLPLTLSSHGNAFNHH